VLVDSAGFASAGRWRPGFNAAPGAVTLRYGSDWLSAHYTPPPPPGRPSPVRIVVADAPVPVPVVVAGPGFPQPGGVVAGLAGQIGLRSVEVVAAATGLPGVGGDGFLIDNEYASRLAGPLPAGAARYEVWLAAAVPESTVDELSTRLTILGVETPAQRASALLHGGAGRANRLALVAALAGLVLAAVAVTVIAAIDRGSRVAELRALQVQGLSPRAARTSFRLSYAWFALGGVLVGGLAAAVSWPAVRAIVPTFVDGWTVTASPAWPRPMVALLVLGFTAAALLVAVLLASWPMARALTTVETRPAPGRPRAGTR
jgi:hypothetical protein